MILVKYKHNLSFFFFLKNNIFKEGEQSNNKLYFIVKGEVELYHMESKKLDNEVLCLLKVPNKLFN